MCRIHSKTILGGDDVNLNKSPEELGIFLANAHKQTQSGNSCNGVVWDGVYLSEKSRKLNMPFHSEIYTALEKTDFIINYVTSTVPYPFVKLQNRQQTNGKHDAYGNPAWDIGAVIILLNDSGKADKFLQEYIKR